MPTDTHECAFGLRLARVSHRSTARARPRAPCILQAPRTPFVSVLRSAEFRTQAGALPGYDASQPGVIAEVDSVIAYRELS